MKITKSQLKDIIKEELEGVVGPSPTTSARLLKERKDRIRIQLDETYSPAHLDELAEILAEAPEVQGRGPGSLDVQRRGGVGKPWEMGVEAPDESFVTGVKRVSAGATGIDWDDLEMKKLTGGSKGDQLIELGEIILWMVDALPKVMETISGTPEAEAGFFIKLARVVSRATGGILFSMAGKAMISIGEWVNDKWPPEKQDAILKGAQGSFQDKEPKQITAPATPAAVAERKRRLKQRR